MKPDASSREVEVLIERRRLPRRLRRAGGPATPPAPRIPRITRLMALAIKFDEMVRRGEVRDYADLARLGYVTRARITQIMNLLNLVPEIQEGLLFLPPGRGCGPITERHLRFLAQAAAWSEQRLMWSTPSADLKHNRVHAASFSRCRAVSVPSGDALWLSDGAA